MRAALLITAALLAAAPAAGQCYRTSACAPTYAYHQPVYVQQQYVPHYEHYTQTAVVGAAYPVYLPLLSYTSLADDVRAYYGQKRATKEAYLEALREAAAEGLFSVGVPAPPGGPTPAASLQRLPGVYDERTGLPLPQNADGSVKQGLVPALPDVSSPPPIPKAPPKPKAVQIGKVLAASCASCHNPRDGAEHVDLSGPADRIPGDVRNLCVTWAADGSMPKKGEKLTQQEFDALQAWAKAARPNLVRSIPAAQPADRK